MVITRIHGGLGNQMFQYAFGLAVAAKTCTDLFLDVREFESDSRRRYGLDRFNISAVPASVDDLPPDRRKQRLRYLLWRYAGTSPKMIREAGLSYNDLVWNMKGDVYLHGYWQSERYFAEIGDKIRSQFELSDICLTPRSRSVLQKIRRSAGRSVSVHVRRGDYVDNLRKSPFKPCSQEYYRKALKFLKTVVGDPLDVFVFSDDPDWVEANMSVDANWISIRGNDSVSEPHGDMRLMAACTHNIIANSTFSWWAAWLNDNANKMVVAPAVWTVSKAAR